MDNYTPKKNQMEWHLTYKCNLACRHCNRACFLPPQTRDMTLDDAREVVKQAQELGWHPRVLFMGGEPTLHPQFMEFLRIAKELSPEIQVWSNGYSAATKAILAQVEREGLAFVERATQKPEGSMNHQCLDWFVAPADYGESRADHPCGCHAGYEAGCGISVDAEGYTLCCCGGAIDGLLKLGARTRRLAALFEPDFAYEQTRLLCDHCGRLWPRAQEILPTLPAIRGSFMSSCWADAAKRAIQEAK